MIINIERYGNTTNGTLPLCLWEWEDKFKKGDNLILAAFGGGFTWGSVYLKWAYWCADMQMRGSADVRIGLKMTGASIFKSTPLQIIKPKEYICTRQAEHY